MCGQGEETNWHMFAECCGSAEVLQSRVELVDMIHMEVRRQLPKAPHFAEAVCQLLQVDGSGKLCEWGGLLLSDDEAAEAGLGVVLEIDTARKIQRVLRKQGAMACG